MTNAKQELLGILKDNARLKCALISYEESWDSKKEIILSLNYTESEYNQFLKNLDFSYDSGYGGQELYGTVWLEDGTWLSRGEYDGSEWWDHNVLPAVPSQCLVNIL